MNAMVNTVKQKNCKDFYILLNTSCPSLCLNAIMDETNSVFFLDKRAVPEDFSSNAHRLINFSNVVSNLLCHNALSFNLHVRV